MGWKKVTTPVAHICDKPYYQTATALISAGDVIQCDCGKLWKCTSVDYGAQHDPFPTPVLRWRGIGG